MPSRFLVTLRQPAIQRWAIALLEQSDHLRKGDRLSNCHVGYVTCQETSGVVVTRTPPSPRLVAIYGVSAYAIEGIISNAGMRSMSSRDNPSIPRLPLLLPEVPQN